MDDKELVEVWRSEFIDLNSHVYPPYMVYNHGDRKFNFDGTECMWQGFLLARRSQPSVVLPEKDHYYLDDDVYDADEVLAALTAAGIKYTIGE